ncbi:solute carrier family 43 member 3 [Corvus cornix cornix]|uniref:solute carrier family 43 member 3 n=1 Tax=Corvus cornix cornix TaxID=932674 RepID=UPI00194FAA69|nr:solute carrier family 43 member 3 [Corvus cornix cornix]XP_039409180.1 solute carrier family 43 member 3 [Corvus cornix cornix]
MAGGAGLAKRLGTFLSGLLECGAFCGIIFGWASLVFVLKDLGYFEGLCQPSATPGPNLTLGSDCSGQDEQFSLVFTIGSFMNNFMTFPMGVVFDRFGTMAARLIAISLYAGGTLLVAFSTPEMAVLLFPAMSMLSVGGILLILTNMQVGNLFGNYRSILITLYNGAFDSSSAIFLIVKLLYEHGLSLRAMFLFLAACSAWHLLRTLFLMPRTHIPYPLPPDYDYGLRCWGRSRSYRTYKDKQPSAEAAPEETPLEPPIPRGGAPSGTPFRACACSWLFAWHVAWLSVMQLRHYLFIGTLNPQLEHLAHGDHGLVSTYTNAFAFTQLCGVLCAPWNGLILDRHKRGKGPRPEGALAALADLRSAVLSLVVTVAQCLLFSVLAAVPVLPVQFGTFVLQVISRSFLYGGNAAFLAIAFPPQHFGKLYGLAMALSALVALLQYPCVALVQGPLQGDPFYMNLGLIAVVLVAFVSPVVVTRECQRRAKELGMASTPLAAAPSAEIHVETPH